MIFNSFQDSTRESLVGTLSACRDYHRAADAPVDWLVLNAILYKFPPRQPAKVLSVKGGPCRSRPSKVTYDEAESTVELCGDAFD